MLKGIMIKVFFVLSVMQVSHVAAAADIQKDFEREWRKAEKSNNCQRKLDVAWNYYYLSKMPEAMVKMGYLWTAGCGVPRSYRKAYSWYMEAAYYQNQSAMIELGNLHATNKGMGVEYNVDKAVSWYTLAARMGSVEAQAKLIALGRPVPATDIQFTQTIATPVKRSRNKSNWLAKLGEVLLYATAAYYGAKAGASHSVTTYVPSTPQNFSTRCTVSGVSGYATINCKTRGY